MVSNLDKFKLLDFKVDCYISSILEKLRASNPELDQFLSSSTQALYSYYFRDGEYRVSKLEVVSYRVKFDNWMIRPIVKSRATPADVSRISEYYQSIKQSNATVAFTVKCDFSLREITLDSMGTSYFFSEAKASEIVKELNESYQHENAPKEGYTPCAYCGKQVPTESLYWRTILKRNLSGLSKDKLGFCSSVCADRMQMANDD